MSLELLSMAPALLLAVLVGVSLGLLGGGGSILTVPLLVYGFGLGTHEAIATSLFVVGATSAAGMIPHARRGKVDFRTGLIFGGTSMVGAFAAGRVAHLIPGSILLIGFAAMMLATAIMMMRPRRPRATDPAGHEVPKLPWVQVMLEGLVVGSVTGLVGAGGGFLVVPALVLLGGLSMETAIGTSLLVIALKSFAAFAGHLGTLHFDMGLAGMVTAAAIGGSLVGSRWASAIPQDLLKRGFGWFVLVMATFLLSQEVPRLLGQPMELARDWPLVLGLLVPVVVAGVVDLRGRRLKGRASGGDAAPRPSVAPARTSA